jgi:hypothetical protein
LPRKILGQLRNLCAFVRNSAPPVLRFARVIADKARQEVLCLAFRGQLQLFYGAVLRTGKKRGLMDVLLVIGRL